MRSPVFAAVAAAIVLCGCGGASGGRIVRTGASRTTAATRGALTAAPTPLTIADVARQPAGSARQAVLQLMYFVQWGSAPNIVATYDSRVISAVGADNLAGAWMSNRLYFLGAALRILDEKPTRAGTLVTLDVLIQGAPTSHESFLLVQDNGQWRDLYDTLTESLLAQYVQGVVQQQVGPTTTKSTPRAVLAGAQAATRFRDVALSLPRR